MRKIKIPKIPELGIPEKSHLKATSAWRLLCPPNCNGSRQSGTGSSPSSFKLQTVCLQRFFKWQSQRKDTLFVNTRPDIILEIYWIKSMSHNKEFLPVFKLILFLSDWLHSKLGVLPVHRSEYGKCIKLAAILLKMWKITAANRIRTCAGRPQEISNLSP